MRCTSLKANLGHLEAAAAGAGLGSILSVPLANGLAAPNVQLRQLNAHLIALVSSSFDSRMEGGFRLQVELITGFEVETQTNENDHGGVREVSAMTRLSSFGFSGTIGHARVSAIVGGNGEACLSLVSKQAIHCSSVSLFRSSKYTCGKGDVPLRFAIPRMPLATGMKDTGSGVVAEGSLGRPLLCTLWDHVVGDKPVFPGVGYVELAFAQGVGTGVGGHAALINDV